MEELDFIKSNLDKVYENIKIACKKAGRDYKDVHLIAVTKTKPIPYLKKANECGEVLFGENKVQEILSKYDSFDSRIDWHMIGHLQRNKVKYIIDKVAMIHSVDSIRLAETIQKEAEKHNLVMPILVEVNVGEEESKFGIKIDETEDFIRKISEFNNIRVKGLMQIAPNVDNPEENRELFRSLRKKMVDINSKMIDNINMNVLSMGMTGDYMIAIEEGATHIRVGTGIFGERNYKNI